MIYLDCDAADLFNVILKAAFFFAVVDFWKIGFKKFGIFFVALAVLIDKFHDVKLKFSRPHFIVLVIQSKSTLKKS